MQNLKYSVVLVALCALFSCDAETYNITSPQPKCCGKEKASILLDVAKDFMNKAKYFYPECINDDLNCERKEKSLAYLAVASNVISEAKNVFPNCSETVCPEPECPNPPTCPETECPDPPTSPEPHTSPIPPTCPEPECPVKYAKPMDCSEVLQLGEKKSGVYAIWPKNLSKPLIVYCEMDTDGGGWTVIQRRGKFSNSREYFYKDWESYKVGFGDITQEFWLGNDNIHAISNQVNTSIRFDLADAQGRFVYALYDTFWIEDENSAYTLHIGGYSGTAGDSMETNNNQKFSTKDRNNGGGDVYCGEVLKGGWWYLPGWTGVENCGLVNLNGFNQPGVNSREGMYWFRWRLTHGLSIAEMRLRPLKKKL